MADIPGIPELGTVRSPEPAVKLDAAALEAPARAGMQLGAAVQDVGAAVQAIAMKRQEAKNTADLIDAQGKLAATRQTFIEGLQHNTVESTWVKSWQETAKETQDTLIGKDAKLAPEVRQRLALDIQDWQNTTAIHVGLMANKAQNQRGRLKILKASDEHTKDGDEKSALSAIDAGVKVGLFFPEEGDKLKDSVGQKIDYYGAKNYIDNHPVGAVDYLTDKTPTGRYRNLNRLDPAQRDALITEAKRRANQSQAENLSGMVGALDDNPDNPPTREQLDTLVKAGRISQAGSDSLMRRVNQTNLKKSRDDSAVLHMEVYDHDFTADKNPEETARKFKDESAALPPPLRKPINDLIDNRLAASKKKTATEENPIEKEVFSSMASDRKTGLFYASPDMLTPGNKPAKGQIDKQAEDDERLRYGQTMQRMRDWFKAHPKATFEEADKYRSEITLPHLMGHVLRSINPDSSARTITGKDEYDELKKGEVYFFNGVRYTKQ